MNTKKDIGSQVKALMENQNVSPSDSVWSNLENELKEKKKKRRLFFLWMSFGAGVIAVLFFSLFYSNLEFRSENKSHDIIVIGKNSNTEDSNSNSNNNSIANEKLDNNTSENYESKSNIDNSNYNNDKLINDLGNDESLSNTKITTKKSSHRNDSNNTKTIVSQNTKKTSKVIKNNSLNNKKDSKLTNGISGYQSSSIQNKTNLARTKAASAHNTHSIRNNDNQKTVTLSSFKNKKEDISSKNITLKETEKNKTISENNLNSAEELSNDNSNYSSSNENEELSKKQLNNLTNLDEEKEVKLEEEEEEEKEEKKKEESLNNWSIFPHVSLDFYGSLNQPFNKNITLNYGAYLGYSLHEDIMVRIGVNQLKFKYQLTENSIKQFQELNYLELPLEIKHNIIKKRINTYAIYGISYLFLNNASIMTSENENRISNKTDFENMTISFNLGLNFQKNIFKNLYFNVEPVFKYHFKTYKLKSNSSTFATSILTGIEYKF